MGTRRSTATTTTTTSTTTDSIASDDPPTKVVQQMHRPYRTISGSVWRVCRLPHLVVAPDEGPLILQPSSMPSVSLATVLDKPMILSPTSTANVPVCNIAVDPRLYKGSIFAARRQAAETARKFEQEQQAESRYRVDVIRSRLEQSLPQLNLAHQHQAPHQVPSPARCSRYPKCYTTNTTSSINIGVNSKAPICARRSFLPPAVSIDKGIRVRHLPQLKRIESNRSKHVRIRDSPPSVLPTPPPSARIQYLIVDTSVQTDDTFEVEACLLARKLASSAILQAIENLHYENRVLELKIKAEDAMILLENERLNKSENERKLEEKLIAKEQELEACAKRSEQVILSKELAVKTCKEVTNSSLSKVEKLEKMNPKTKSVGIETRQMNRTQRKIDLMTIELEKDFFPWLFAQADEICRQQLAITGLENAASKKEYTRRKRKSYSNVKSY